MKRVPLVIAGVGFGLAVGARLDMGLAIAMAFVVVALARRPSIRWLVSGLAIGLVPLVVNLAEAGVSSVIRDQITDPILVSGAARRLPLDTLTGAELALLVLCVIIAIAIASVMLGVIAYRRDKIAWGAVSLLCIGVFEIGLLPQAFQRSDPIHLALVSCFILPAAVTLPRWHKQKVLPKVAASWIRVAFVVMVLLLAWPYFGRIYRSAVGFGGGPSKEFTVTNDGRSVPVGSASEASEISALLRELNGRSHTGQTVFVGPLDLRTANYNDTFIYFLLPQLNPGSYYLEMNPGVANGSGSTLANDLRQDDFLILSSRYDSLYDPDPATRTGPNTPNEVVQTHFQEIGAEGSWTLYDRGG